ncbi:unnamed protein product, partial [Mesorhabditis spiculigera]
MEKCPKEIMLKIAGLLDTGSLLKSNTYILKMTLTGHRGAREIHVTDLEKLEAHGLKLEPGKQSLTISKTIKAVAPIKKFFIYVKDPRKYVLKFVTNDLRLFYAKKINLKQLTLDKRMYEAFEIAFREKRKVVKALTLDSCRIEVQPSDFRNFLLWIGPRELTICQLITTMLDECDGYVETLFFLIVVPYLDYLFLDKFRSKFQYTWEDGTDLALGVHRVHGDEGVKITGDILPPFMSILRFYNMDGMDERDFYKYLENWLAGTQKITFWRFQLCYQEYFEDENNQHQKFRARFLDRIPAKSCLVRAEPEYFEFLTLESERGGTLFINFRQVAAREKSLTWSQDRCKWPQGKSRSPGVKTDASGRKGKVAHLESRQMQVAAREKSLTWSQDRCKWPQGKSRSPGVKTDASGRKGKVAHLESRQMQVAAREKSLTWSQDRCKWPQGKSRSPGVKTDASGRKGKVAHLESRQMQVAAREKSLTWSQDRCKWPQGKSRSPGVKADASGRKGKVAHLESRQMQVAAREKSLTWSQDRCKWPQGKSRSPGVKTDASGRKGKVAHLESRQMQVAAREKSLTWSQDRCKWPQGKSRSPGVKADDDFTKTLNVRYAARMVVVRNCTALQVAAREKSLTWSQDRCKWPQGKSRSPGVKTDDDFTKTLNVRYAARMVVVRNCTLVSKWPQGKSRSPGVKADASGRKGKVAHLESRQMQVAAREKSLTWSQDRCKWPQGKSRSPGVKADDDFTKTLNVRYAARMVVVRNCTLQVAAREKSLTWSQDRCKWPQGKSRSPGVKTDDDFTKTLNVRYAARMVVVRNCTLVKQVAAREKSLTWSQGRCKWPQGKSRSPGVKTDGKSGEPSTASV